MMFSVIERTATLTALVQLLGAASFRVFVATPALRAAIARGDSPAFGMRLEQAARRIGGVAGIVLVVLAAARMHDQVGNVFESWSAASASDIRTLILGTTWGHGWLLQVIAALVIAAGVFAGKSLDAWMAVPLAVSAAMNGHPAATDPVVLSVALNATHALAAGGWVGGLFLLFVAGAFRPTAIELMDLVRRFNTVALSCSAIVLLTGVIASIVLVGSFDALFSSEYGAQLIAKLVLVGITAALGAHNWKRGTPALARGDDRIIRRGIFLEVVFSFAIVIATARLVVMSPP